jgi:hypothetical protein
LRAEGSAQALETVYSVAQTVDSKTMSLQYLETLRALGSGPATKIVIPMEFTTMLQPLLNLAGANPAPPPSGPAPAMSVSDANGHNPAVAAPALASVSPPENEEGTQSA